MQLSVQKALQRQGERLEFRVELGLEPFEFCGDQIAPCGPVLVEGHMMGVEDRIELDGVKSPCAGRTRKNQTPSCMRLQPWTWTRWCWATW